MTLSGLTHALLGDWHSAVYAAIKAFGLFLTAATAFRFSQRRALAEFTPFDWAVAVAIGAIIGRVATASSTSWLTGSAAIVTLILVHAVIAHLRFRPRLRRLIDPPLRVLVEDGRVNERNLRRSGLTRSDLDALLRQHGHPNPDRVHLALFEEQGKVSVLDRPLAP